MFRLSPIDRFRAKCEFDPATGCALWTGGTSAGQGNSVRYGRFWFEGRSWYAHRWAAIYIHGLAVGELDVAHCCPHGHNSLCVEHVTVDTRAANVAERNVRVAVQARQDNLVKQFWLFVHLGIEPRPERPLPDGDDIPFYTPPAWLQLPPAPSECPF